MIWQQNKIQVSCLWLHPVSLIWYARIHHSQLNKTRAKGRVWEVSIILMHVLPPSLKQCVLGSAPPLCRCSACCHLVRYFQAQTVNNGGEQTTTTEQKHAPPLPASKRRNRKTDKEKQSKNTELNRAREKTRINNEALFQRWRSCRVCKNSRTMQS